MSALHESHKRLEKIALHLRPSESSNPTKVFPVPTGAEAEEVEHSDVKAMGDRGSLESAFGTFVGSVVSDECQERADEQVRSEFHRDRFYLGLNTRTYKEMKDISELDIYGTLKEKHWKINRKVLIHKIEEVRDLVMTMVGDLSDDNKHIACLHEINDPKWTVGHVTSFYDFNVLALVSQIPDQPRLPGASLVFDSFRFPHDKRWHLPKHMTLEAVRAYYYDTHEEVLNRLKSMSCDYMSPIETWIHVYGVIHMYWHFEDMFQTRESLQLPHPQLYPNLDFTDIVRENGPYPGDALIDCGGWWDLGCRPQDPWVFDAEKWSHRVRVPPFKIAKASVTNAEYLEFIAARGYYEERYWSFEGWEWRQKTEIIAPKYWKFGKLKGKSDGRDRWFVHMNGVDQPLSPHHPVIHVNYHEAEAYCTWANRRLPTEAEWEAAACGATGSGSPVSESDVLLYPWGNADYPDDHWKFGNLDARVGRLVDVNSYPQGDSKCGCRQMIGNVWEWTCTTLYPFPGFQPDFPYRENAAPFFGRPKLNKGGAWPTSGLIARNKNRTWDWPELQANFTGFRTCALD